VQDSRGSTLEYMEHKRIAGRHVNKLCQLQHIEPMPMHVLGFFMGVRPPESGELSFRPTKGTSLAGKTSFDV